MSAFSLPSPVPRPEPPPAPWLVAGISRAGTAAASALRGRGPVLAWDAARTGRTERAAEELEAAGVEVELGGDGVSLLDRGSRVGSVVKSPGIAMDAPLIAAARARGLAVVDELELGWRLDTRPLIGITGTNGKSTVTALVSEILGAAGIEAPVCGNTAFGPPLSGAGNEPGEALACEVSSFQLEGCTDFLPEVGVLTNVTHDHLYRHRSLAAYAALKRSMLVRGGRTAKVVVAGVDSPAVATVAGELSGRTAVITFGRSPGATWRVRDDRWSIDRGTVPLQGPDGELELETHLPGPHNALNVAAAVCVAAACGIELELAAGVISRFRGVPGRFEVIGTGSGPRAIVDYAHNPDGVAQALATARPLLGGGRLIVVVSVLDIYDSELAREVGRAAASSADLVLATTDRYRAESPAVPDPHLVAGARDAGARVEAVPDRRLAIERAMDRAEDHDVVLVLGRGAARHPLHEPSGEIVRADDAELVRAALGLR